ncbi:MAG: hypothetical protein ABMB14_11660 [Myxococcota bacterium]
MNSVATVDEDGDIAGEDDGYSVKGDFSFDDCAASGTWYYLGALAGTWSLAREG